MIQFHLLVGLRSNRLVLHETHHMTHEWPPQVSDSFVDSRLEKVASFDMSEVSSIVKNIGGFLEKYDVALKRTVRCPRCFSKDHQPRADLHRC